MKVGRAFRAQASTCSGHGESRSAAVDLLHRMVCGARKQLIGHGGQAPWPRAHVQKHSDRYAQPCDVGDVIALLKRWVREDPVFQNWREEAGLDDGVNSLNSSVVEQPNFWAHYKRALEQHWFGKLIYT